MEMILVSRLALKPFGGLATFRYFCARSVSYIIGPVAQLDRAAAF